MSENGFEARGAGRYALSGQLTFQSVPQFFAHTSAMFGDADGPLTVDLAGISLADSAGLALLIEWEQRARAANRSLHFENIPEQVRQIIRVSGLQHAFNL